MSQWLLPRQWPSRSLLGSDTSVPVFDRLLDKRHSDVTLTYAKLCTRTEQAAWRLVEQALERFGSQQLDDSGTTVPGLPGVPRLLCQVRDVAAEWTHRPRTAKLLDADLIAWLGSAGSRQTHRGTASLALRSLCDMRPFDTELLWWNQVEALSAAELAAHLGWAPDHTGQAVRHAASAFAERCRANHLEGQRHAQCRSYTGMMDAVARRQGGQMPQEVVDHLTTCAPCKELSACLTASAEGTLGDLLAMSALQWQGTAYARARRTAYGMTARPAVRHIRQEVGQVGKRLIAVVSLLVVVVVVITVQGLSLEATRPALKGSAQSAGEVAPQSSASQVPPRTSTAGNGRRPEAPAVKTSDGRRTKTSAVPRAKTSASSRVGPSSVPPLCTSRITLTDTWDGGGKAELKVVPAHPVGPGWTVTFMLGNGVSIRDTWNGTSTTDDGFVSVAPAGYNRSLTAGQPLVVGFVLDGDVSDDSITYVRLDGHLCASG